MADAAGPPEAAEPSAPEPPGSAEPVLEPRDGVGTPDRFRRLWTPHRLAYIVSATVGGRAGLPVLPDPDAARRRRAGRRPRRRRCTRCSTCTRTTPATSWCVPYRHVAGLEDLDDAESAELMTVTRTALRALRAVSAPHAFNVGINLGAVAGGSLADHLHQHVVPRWGGDANFIAVDRADQGHPAAAVGDPRAARRGVARGRARRRRPRARPPGPGPPGPEPSARRVAEHRRYSGGSRTGPATRAGAMLNLFRDARQPGHRSGRAAGSSPAASPRTRSRSRAPSARRPRRWWFIPRGRLFLGALLATVFVLFDMIDGAMARARGSQHAVRCRARLRLRPDRRRRAVRRDHLVVPGERAGGARAWRPWSASSPGRSSPTSRRAPRAPG